MVFIFKKMAYQNINQYNYPKLKLQLVYDGQDMSLASDEKNFNEEVVFSPYLIAQTYGKKLPVYFDIDNPLTWIPKELTYKNYDQTNIFVSQNYYEPDGLDLDCFKVDTACDIGLTGIDNGLVNQMTGKTITFTNGLFNDFLKFQRLYFDRRLKMFQVTGYTGTYNRFSAITQQTLYEVVSKDNIAVGKYHELYGGFYQGFHKLFGYDYDILPNRVNKGWTVEMLLKPRLFEEYQPGPGETTLNEIYPRNKNMFFYWGTRAENKFYHHANGSPWNYSGYTRVTSPLYNCIETCACCNTGVTNSRCIYVYPPRSQNNQHDPHVNYGCNVCNGNPTPQCGCSCGQLPCLECGWECQTHTCAPASPTPTPTPTPTTVPVSCENCENQINLPLPGNSISYVSGITISASGSGDITTNGLPTGFIDDCGFINLQNSIALGQNVPFGSPYTYTLTFSQPVNNISIVLLGYNIAFGPSPTEYFVITTNTGNNTPEITLCSGCCASISGNVITASNVNGDCVPETNSGAGQFNIRNSQPFTSLTISGNGGSSGSLITICDHTPLEINNAIITQDGYYLIVGDNQYLSFSGSNTIVPENLSENFYNDNWTEEVYVVDKLDFPNPSPTPTPTPTLPPYEFVCPPDKPSPTCSPQANICNSCGFPIDDCDGGTCSSCGCGCNQPKPNPWSSVEDTCEKDPKYDTISNNLAFKLGGDPKNPTICVRVLKITGACEVSGTCVTGVTYETGCTITEICTPPIYPYCLEVNPAWLELEHWFQIDAVWERYTYIESCDLFWYGGLGVLTREEYLQSLANNAPSLIAPPYTNDRAVAEKITLIQMNNLWLEQEKFRRGRLKIYVNGRKFFTIENFEEMIPRALSTDKERQLGVPFNMSWGGGTQGLHENLTFSACTDLLGNYIQDPECFPTNILDQSSLSGMTTNILLEENFGGTFDGGISQFRFYVEPLGADEVKHNFKLLKDKFLMFDPDCPVCDTEFCEPNDFTSIVIPVSPTPTPTTTPAPSVTPTPTPTMTVTPTVTPSPIPGLTPTPTPTITVTATITPTPTPSAAAAKTSYLFIEPVTGATNIGQWMFDGGRDFFGFTNYSQPTQNVPLFNLDMNRYVDFTGWTSGLFPTIITQNVPISSGGLDSFGNSIVAFNFTTTEVLENTVPVDAWYTWIIPVAATNFERQIIIDLNDNGNPNLLTAVHTEDTINYYTFTYTGTTLPTATYRVYTTYPSPIFKILNNKTIYFRGNEVEP